MNKTREPDWLAEVLVAVQQSSGLIARSTRQGKQVTEGKEILLNLGVKGQMRTFSALVKQRLTNESLGYVMTSVRQAGSVPCLLVTPYVTPPQAERLRQANIQFVDAAGNVFLNQPPLYVLVTGRRAASAMARETTTSAFTATGIKIIFTLLCCPNLLAASFREIAAMAGVSLGAVSQTLDALKQAGYLMDQGVKGRLWQKKPELIRRWSEAYTERLRPKLILGRFQTDETEWWKTVSLRGMKACWGGEVAAAKITNYLKPQVKTIYASGKLPRLQAQFSFRPEREGEIELLKKFWSFEGLAEQPDLAPALLIYADLMASGDERNTETAGMIYDQYLA
jgi:hypothetical protein